MVQDSNAIIANSPELLKDMDALMKDTNDYELEHGGSIIMVDGKPKFVNRCEGTSCSIIVDRHPDELIGIHTHPGCSGQASQQDLRSLALYAPSDVSCVLSSIRDQFSDKFKTVLSCYTIDRDNAIYSATDKTVLKNHKTNWADINRHNEIVDSGQAYKTEPYVQVISDLGKAILKSPTSVMGNSITSKHTILEKP